MSNGRYNHDNWAAADGFRPRGPQRTSGDFEEAERKRNHTSRWDNDHGRRDFPSPGGSIATGASGGNGGNGGNGLSIRGRAANDQKLRKESSDPYLNRQSSPNRRSPPNRRFSPNRRSPSNRRSPPHRPSSPIPVHPHRLQTTMQHLAESAFANTSPSSAAPLSVQSNPPDHIMKDAFSEKSKGDNLRDNSPQASAASDRIGFKLDAARNQKSNDDRHDDVFSPSRKGPSRTRSRRSSGADKELSLELSNDFVKAFAEYTEAIVDTSNLTFRSNLLKEKGDKQQSLRHRWHKHHRSFASLAEDQGRRTEKSASTLEQSDLKIKQTRETQEKAVRRLVSSLLANAGVPSPRSLDDSSVNRDIPRIKEDLQDFEDDLNQQMRKTQKHASMLEDMQRDFRDLAANSMTRGAMTDYESKIARITVTLQKLQNLFSDNENAFAQLPHMQDLVDKVKGLLLQFYQDKDEISVRIDQQKSRLDERLDEHISRLDEQISQLDQQKTSLGTLKDEEQGHHKALKDALHNQNGEIQRLKLEVIGDPEQEAKGLIEFIEEGRNQIKQIEKVMQEFDNEMEKITTRVLKLESEMPEKLTSAKFESVLDGLKDNLENLEAKIRLLEEKDSKLDANMGNVLSDKMDLTEPIMKVHDRLKTLEERMEQSEQDALEKDEMVSAEVDRIEQSVKRQEEEIKRLHVQISALRTEIAAAPDVSQPLPPPSPVNSSPTVDESLLQRIPALENDFKDFKDPITHRTNTIEVLVESLQQRFDNLSTEHLATAIIHQMQLLYPPHPANIQNELALTKTRLNTMDQHIPAIWGEIHKFHPRIEQVAHMTPNLRTELIEFIERKIKNNPAKSGPQDYNEMEGRVSHLVNDSHGKFLEAEQKFANFTKDSAESIDNLRNTFEGLKTSLDAQSLRLADVLNDVSALRAENVSNVSSIKQNLCEMGVQLQSREEDLLRELPSIHADIALLNQHVQIKNPTVLAAIAAAQQQEQAEEQQQEHEQAQPASVAGAIDPAPPEPQSLTSDHSPASAPVTDKKTLSSPNNNNDNNDDNIQQSPGALPRETSPKEPPLQPPVLKRSRFSEIQDTYDDAQEDSSQDVRPMKIQRRRGSYNQARKDPDSRAATTPPSRPGSSSKDK